MNLQTSDGTIKTAKNIREIFLSTIEITPIKNVEGACLYASILLAEALRNFNHPDWVCVCGGDGDRDGWILVDGKSTVIIGLNVFL